MEILPLELAQELMKDFFCARYLFQFEWTTPKYFTDMDQDIYYGGHWFKGKGKGIRFDKLDPRADSIIINIDDVGYELRDLILSEDIREKVAQIFLLAIDKSLQPLGSASRRFYGFCDAPSRPSGSNDIEIRIINHMRYWRRLTPRRVTSPTCQWTFKHGPDVVLISGTNYTCKGDQEHCAHTTNRPGTGTYWANWWDVGGSGGKAWVEGDWYSPGTCRYSGPQTWCDKSWERCLELFNTLNFEGRRWIPALQEQKIWWGSPSDPTTRAYVMKK